MQLPKVEVTVKGDVSRLRVGPGDKVIVTYHGRVSRDAVVAAREQLQRVFPMNEVIVIAGGCVHVQPAGHDFQPRR